MVNMLKQRWMDRTAPLVSWLVTPSAYTAEVMTQCGWDALIVDMQHGLHDFASMVASFQAMQAHPVSRLVRVPSNDAGLIGRVLDAGAHGVICPMVNTADEAQALVRAVKYPPAGNRSNGPIRAGLYSYGASSYQSTANSETLVIAMIETATAMANIDDILAVEGLDSVYVGPSDLAFSMGLPPVLDGESPATFDMYRRLIERCNSRGIAAGIHVSRPSYAKLMLEMGFSWVSISSDSGFMVDAARASIDEMRG